MKKYRSIDTAGQITAIITEKINLGELPLLANSIMAKNTQVEQVGCLQGNTFQMMGNELSINGLLAAAYLLKKSGKINDLDFQLTASTVSLTFPSSLVINVDQKEKVVTLQGIVYQVISGFPKDKNISPTTKAVLQKLASNSPASGIIYYQNNQIQPLVYVKATNSYVWENACGSGSLATALITQQKDILQPSEQSISFQFTSKNIVVTVTAKEV